jgi:hypothetical protein
MRSRRQDQHGTKANPLDQRREPQQHEERPPRPSPSGHGFTVILDHPVEGDDGPSDEAGQQDVGLGQPAAQRGPRGRRLHGAGEQADARPVMPRCQ